MIEIVEPGPLTTIQDASGRAGWRHLGVPAGGAADPWSARLANRLVGNADDAAVIEMTLDGATVRALVPVSAAVTGGMAATVDGLPVPDGRAWRVRAGALIRVRATAGARGYLAIAGGISVPPVLGSAATDLRSGFGGVDGRPLRHGDRLEIGSSAARGRAWSGAFATGPIRLVDGPHGRASDLAGDWLVGIDSDRAGVRLDGRVLAGREVDSIGLPVGAVQVPPDGRPIAMLADRPVTGGYGVPACVIRADIGRVAQLRPGDTVSFTSVSHEEAREALGRAEEALAALDAAEAPPDDEPGWAGSHA